MQNSAEFRRRRLVWITGSVAIAGLGIVSAIGWKSGRIPTGVVGPLMMFAATGFLVWGIAGANWVLRTRRPAVANDVSETQRVQRRLYLVSLIPAGTFLWGQLTEIFASPHSVGEVIILPILAVAIAVGYAWVWVAVFSRFLLVMRK